MLDPKEIGRRIAGIRELKHMTLEDVATQVQVSRSTILRYERGEFERIKLPILLSIANALGVSPDYLSGHTDDYGLDEALEYMRKENLAKTLPANAIPYSPSKHVAPILGRIPAGYPVFAASEIEGYAPIDYADVDNYFWLRVSGDSMENADIHSGDLVLIRRQTTADDGQIVAARVNGDEATLKRFRRSGDTVMLVPENPKYLPIPVSAAAFTTGDASIIGVVVELKRKFV